MAPTGFSGAWTATWFSSTWWLCGVDGILPIGDLVYAGTGVVIGSGEFLITYVDKIPGFIDAISNNADKVSDGNNDSSNNINNTNNGNNGPEKK